MAATELPPSRPSFQSCLTRELSIRGIKLIEKGIRDLETIEIPAVPPSPNLPPDKISSFIEATVRTIHKLGLPVDYVSKVDCLTIPFLENTSPDTSHKSSPNEQLRFYHFQEPGPGTYPLVIFSHGGKISPHVISSSGYLSIVHGYCPNMILCAIDHRGSQSYEIGANYSLDSRSTDLLVAIKHTALNLIPQLASRSIKWNRKIVLIGDSMGGHVVATLANHIDIDGIILTEPAAYSIYAQHALMSRSNSTEPTFRQRIRSHPPQDSLALEALGTYKGQVLIIKMSDDSVVSQIPDQYAKHIPPERLKYLTVADKHGSTSSEEVKAISNFIKDFSPK